MILFKYPTRSRPHWFVQTLEKYYSMLSGENQYRFLITLDEDDETMNNDKMKSIMDRYPNLIYRYGQHKTKVEAVNADMKSEDFDILFLVSDDMIPTGPGFDIIIVEKMKEYFPDLDGALHFNDGFLGENIRITLSIMGKKLYDYFGYIYHPDYRSFYCDTEFTDVVRKLGKVKYFPQVIVKHKWSGGPNSDDARYRRNSKLGKNDRHIYNKRKKEGFQIHFGEQL